MDLTGSVVTLTLGIRAHYPAALRICRVNRAIASTKIYDILQKKIFIGGRR